MERSGFTFMANAAWLDFVDTELIDGAQRTELLADGADVVAWGRAAGLVSGGPVDCPDGGAALHAESLTLRAALRGIAGQIANGVAVEGIDVSAVNALLIDHPLVLRAHDGRWRLEPPISEAGPRGLLLAIAADFANFVASADFSRLRGCANPACGYFFHDTSKNGTRRWCSMEVCGNRCKAAQHRARLACREGD